MRKKEKMMKVNRLFVVLLLVLVVLAAAPVAVGESPLPTPASPLPTPTPPGGNGENGFDWTEFLEWVLENKDTIIELVLLVVALVVSWLGRKQVAEKYGVELMREAEELARKHVLESGPDRMRHVVSTLVERLPVDIKAVLRVVAKTRGMTFEELVADLAQKWFEKVAGSA